MGRTARTEGQVGEKGRTPSRPWFQVDQVSPAAEGRRKVRAPCAGDSWRRPAGLLLAEGAPRMWGALIRASFLPASTRNPPLPPLVHTPRRVPAAAQFLLLFPGVALTVPRGAARRRAVRRGLCELLVGGATGALRPLPAAHLRKPGRRALQRRRGGMREGDSFAAPQAVCPPPQGPSFPQGDWVLAPAPCSGVGGQGGELRLRRLPARRDIGVLGTPEMSLGGEDNCKRELI